MEKETKEIKIDWRWRGLKMSIGTKTIVSFVLILLVPVIIIYLTLTTSLKNFFTHDYLDKVGEEIKTINELIETDMDTPQKLGNFIITHGTLPRLLHDNDINNVMKGLRSISSSVNGVNISFVYDVKSNSSLISNGKSYEINRLLKIPLEKVIITNGPLKSYEAIPYDRLLFNENEISLINSNDDYLAIYLVLIPFSVNDKTFIYGSFTVLNNNKYYMDKIYNTFGYNTAIVSSRSLKEKIIATNSSTNNIFYTNQSLPDEIISSISKKTHAKMIFDNDHTKAAIATVALKNSAGEIIGWLGIATSLNDLNVIISEFNGIIVSLLLISGIIILVIAFVVYNDTNKPIEGLLKGMKEVANNNLDIKLNYRTFDDFEDIANYFNQMTENIRKYTLTLNRFNQLNRVITSTLKVDEVLSIATDKILEYTSSQIGVVYLYDKQTDMLNPYYAKNARNEVLKPVKIGEGLVGEVAKSSSYFCISDIKPDQFVIDTGLTDILPSEVVAFPIALKNNLIGVMVVGAVGKHSKEELDLINNLITQVAIVLDNCITHSHVTQLSIKDELTQVYNRRYLINALETELSKAKRTKTPFSIGIFDIDNFKRINDTYGHPTGDLVLKKFAEIIENSKRDYDIFGRFGGEEFLIILPATDQSKLFDILDRLRRNIEEQLIKYTGFNVTCSAGGAAITDYENSTIDTLIAAADKNLYNAKSMGKNRVIV